MSREKIKEVLEGLTKDETLQSSPFIQKIIKVMEINEIIEKLGGGDGMAKELRQFCEIFAIFELADNLTSEQKLNLKVAFNITSHLHEYTKALQKKLNTLIDTIDESGKNNPQAIFAKKIFCDPELAKEAVIKNNW